MLPITSPLPPTNLDYRGWVCRNYIEVHAEDHPHYVEFLTYAEEGLAIEMQSMLSPTNLPIEMCVREDALAKAACQGHADVVKVLLPLVKNPNPIRPFRGKFYEREMLLTALGHAIRNRHASVVALLLETEPPPSYTDSISIPLSGICYSALDLFFGSHREFGPEPDLLGTIIAKMSGACPLMESTVIQIARFASDEEIQILLSLGFSSYFDSNFLNSVIAQTELDTLIDPEENAAKAILVLNEIIKNPGNKIRNYIPLLSNPYLIARLKEIGGNIEQKINPDKHWGHKVAFSALEMASSMKLISHLAHLGADVTTSSFIKENLVHQEALQSAITIMQTSKVPKTHWIRKTAENMDLPELLSLISHGIDVNAQDEKSGWTVLHSLFSSLNFESCHTRDLFELMTGNIVIRMINILIQAGAKPLKDKLGRTPLMCCYFDHTPSFYDLSPIIDMYADFESNYHACGMYRYRNRLRDVKRYFTEESIEILTKKGIHHLIQQFTSELWEHVAYPLVSCDAANTTDTTTQAPSCDVICPVAPTTDAALSNITNLQDRDKLDSFPITLSQRDSRHPPHKRADADTDTTDPISTDVEKTPTKKSKPIDFDTIKSMKV